MLTWNSFHPEISPLTQAHNTLSHAHPTNTQMEVIRKQVCVTLLSISYSDVHAECTDWNPPIDRDSEFHDTSPMARTKRQGQRREQKYQSAMGILHFSRSI